MGLATAGAILGLLSVTEPRYLREIYLCWKQAVSFPSCFQGGPIDFVADIDGIKYKGQAGNYIDNQIFYYGAYEKPTLFLLRDFMRATPGGPGTFIDVGANTGQHSMIMARYAKRVHAFEPWEPVLKRFRLMVAENGIKNIFIHAYGLGEHNSKKPFFKPRQDNLGTGSFVADFNPDNSLEGELEIQKGDDAFANENITSVAVIKMDIEGYEKLALRGLRRTLMQHRPIVVFEITINRESPVSIKSPEELAALFPGNYEFLVISARSDALTGAYFLEPVDRIVRFDKAAQYDLVAYPAERKNDISRQGPLR